MEKEVILFMIEEPFIFLIVLILSCIMTNLLSKSRLGPFHPIALRFFFIGMIIHELCHYFAHLTVGIVPEGMEIKWRHRKTRARMPHGSVRSKPRSFLQALVICLAPLYISTWLIFLTFYVMLSPSYHIILRVLAGIICISLFFGAAPSSTDFGNIIREFKRDPTQSFYQLGLIGISGFILWAFVSATKIIFVLDVFYYLFIAGTYLCLKFTVSVIIMIIHKLQQKNFKKPRFLRYGGFIRRRYKPTHPRNFKYSKESEW